MEGILFLPNEVQEDNPRWAHLKIERFWDGTFPGGSRDYDNRVHCVAECTVLEFFYDKRAANNDRESFYFEHPQEGGTCYVFFRVGLDTAENKKSQTFIESFERADSIIVYGTGQSIEVDLRTENGRILAKEYALPENASLGLISPVIWPEQYANSCVIPIRDGKVDTSIITDFRIQSTHGYGLFDDGTDLETVLTNIRTYVANETGE